jgi:hypothetical protein
MTLRTCWWSVNIQGFINGKSSTVRTIEKKIAGLAQSTFQWDHIRKVGSSLHEVRFSVLPVLLLGTSLFGASLVAVWVDMAIVLGVISTSALELM